MSLNSRTPRTYSAGPRLAFGIVRNVLPFERTDRAFAEANCVIDMNVLFFEINLEPLSGYSVNEHHFLEPFALVWENR